MGEWVNGEKVQVMSQAALGRSLDLSPPAITKLKKLGMPVDSVEGAQAWRRARQNIAQRKPAPSAAPAAPPAQPDAPVDGETHDKARTRREIAEANLAELKLAELRGELVRVADVRMAAAREDASLREALLQLPARLAPQLAAMSDQAKCHDLLQIELNAVLLVLTEA